MAWSGLQKLRKKVASKIEDIADDFNRTLCSSSTEVWPYFVLAQIDDYL